VASTTIAPVQRAQAAEAVPARDVVEHVMAVLEALAFLREGRDAEAVTALEQRLAVVVSALRQEDPTRERDVILDAASALNVTSANDDGQVEQIRAWSQLAVSMYPLTHSANVLVVPVAQLREVVKGDRPRSETPKVAQVLEAGLDHLIVGLDRGFLAGGYDAPPESVRDVVSLVAAYRKVFPTRRSEYDWDEYQETIRIQTLWQASERMQHEAARVDALLTSAASPSEVLLRRAPPALRDALGKRRQGLTALWSAVLGAGPPPEIELQTGPDDLVLRLDADDVTGRLRLYGDGRVVVTGFGPEPTETVQRLSLDESKRLVLGVIDGGLLSTDKLEAWRASGAPGCTALSTAPREGNVIEMSVAADTRRRWLSVTVALAKVEETNHGESLGPMERTASFLPARLVDSRCVPTEPVVRELQAGVAALLTLVKRVDSYQQSRSVVAREISGLSIAFIGAGSQGVWITDGQRTARISNERIGPGLFASGDGRFIAYRGELRTRLMLFDRETGGPPTPLGPDEWSGYWTQWSPRSDALILAGEAWTMRSRSIYIADAAGGNLRELTSAANGWPASWSADGRLVYLQYSTTGGKGLRILDLEGNVSQVEDPRWNSARDFVPSPDGRHLAYQTYELDGAINAGVFTIPLDAATGLPVPGAEPTQVASGHPSFCWSPDSRALIYSHGDGLHEVAVDGRDRRVLVDAPFGEYRDAFPQVSRDGRWLLFLRQSLREAGTGMQGGYLYVARRDGSEPLQVGYGQRPVWVNGALGDVEEATPPPAPSW
jgi:hypothetical protein